MKGLELKLFAEYKYLIKPIARKYNFRNPSFPMEDLEQTGAIGLVKAIRCYDASKGELKAFARTCIDREIFHYVRDRKRLIKIPRTYSDLYFKGEKFKHMGWEDSDIAARLNVKIEKWLEASNAMKTPVCRIEGTSNIPVAKTACQTIDRKNFTLNVQRLSQYEIELAQRFWVEGCTLKDIRKRASELGYKGNRIKEVLSTVALKAAL